ncbi:Class I SAM-dependent methyltransferase [Sulfidibacter corallicola]|uniref:Class I SAM-dependent methyltransferase n=1 Tax=Sulfidibacter corallicola TaxID=2818388 RepID=A0A8A4TRJ8_SULCO|nr:class I SAM-dependent methyltransferase [Sulfidibacter corallicola]QTD49155.1 class I SAM-dependent methyltransferase [Sulfidibacter corallicola]
METSEKPFLKDYWEGLYREADMAIGPPDPVLVEIAADLKPGRAVDLGAGDGANSLWLAECGWQVDAVDFASQALDRATYVADRRGFSMSAHVADLLAYQPDQPADLVLFSFIHLPPEQRRRMLAHASEMLAPGGTMIYIGITEVDMSEHGIAPEVFASMEAVVTDLPADLKPVRTEQKPRTVEYNGTEHPHIGVTVTARKGPAPS